MGALTGLRVLDLSRVLAGPWCSQILADLGAEVIKVERPQQGDDTRKWGPPWMRDDVGNNTEESGYYQSTNRNKMAISVDISTAEGQALLHDMIQDVDVLIENYKVGSLVKYHLDYTSLSQINPKLIYCSITGFGQNGPRATEPGYDFIIQGVGGLMSVTGEKTGEPQKVGVAVVDIQTGLYATIAIQAALWSRQTTGKGQYIDMALFDVQLATLANQGMNYLTSHIAPKRLGNTHPNIVPYQVFEAKDGAFILACGNDTQFRDMCIAIDRADLTTDVDFIQNKMRVIHRERLVSILSTHFLTENAQFWVDRIHAKKVPVGRINTIEDALNEPQVEAREMLITIPHPQNTAFQMIASPIKLSDTPVEYRYAPPRLGEDTLKVLSEYRTEEQINTLLAQGIIAKMMK